MFPLSPILLTLENTSTPQITGTIDFTHTASILSEGQITGIVIGSIILLFIMTLTTLLSKTPYLINNYPSKLTFILKDLIQIYGQVKMILFAYKSILFKTTVADIFETQAKKNADSIFLIQNSESWSYSEVNKAINRLSHTIQSIVPELPQQSTVCVLMDNSVEYIVSWHAILKLGLVGALLNTHISPPQLLHCINTASPIFFICDSANLDVLVKLQRENTHCDFSKVKILVLDVGVTSPWLLLNESDVLEVLDVLHRQCKHGLKKGGFVDYRIDGEVGGGVKREYDEVRFDDKKIEKNGNFAQIIQNNKTVSPSELIGNNPISFVYRQSLLYHTLYDFIRSEHHIIDQENQNTPNTPNSPENSDKRYQIKSLLHSPSIVQNVPETTTIALEEHPEDATYTELFIEPTLDNSQTHQSTIINLNVHIQDIFVPYCISLLQEHTPSLSSKLISNSTTPQHTSITPSPETRLTRQINSTAPNSAPEKTIFNSKQLFQSVKSFFHANHLSQMNPPRSLRSEVDYNSTGLLIYTSGTTGMPKAAIVRNSRIVSSGDVFVQNFGINKKDRLYTVLPLYHSAGGVCSTYAAVLTGASLVIKKKLSTREFWKDCYYYNVTIIQYIGELCRYLINTSPLSHPGYDDKYEKLHQVRMAFGNGLRSDVWLQFQERFNIPSIAEFYAATEGNVALFCLYNRENVYHSNILKPFYKEGVGRNDQNGRDKGGEKSKERGKRENKEKGKKEDNKNNENKENNKEKKEKSVDKNQKTLKSVLADTTQDSKYGFGSVGNNGPLTRFLSGFTIVKYDVENDQIIKDKDTGYAIQCDYNEPGLLVAPIITWDPVRRYGGYYKPKSGGSENTKNDSKILTNLFKQGDEYFNTGDILNLDEWGYWRFNDRIGDTFRWKSENVSTQEVESICTSFAQSLAKIDEKNNVEKKINAERNENNKDDLNNDNITKPVFDTINCYGIEIPGQDGRCCMIAVTLLPPFVGPNATQFSSPKNSQIMWDQISPEKINFDEFYQFCSKSFSAFSQPAFIRFIAPQNQDNTGTFKLKKAVLRAQGAQFYVDRHHNNPKTGAANSPRNDDKTVAKLNASAEGDIVYSVRHDLKTFVELTPELWEQYVKQTAKL